MAEFKFPIGSLVITRSGIADCMAAARQGGLRHPLHYTVLEQLRQECPGGVQFKYLLGGWTRHALEQELAAPEEFDNEECLRIAGQVQAKIRADEDAERWGRIEAVTDAQDRAKAAKKAAE